MNCPHCQEVLPPNGSADYCPACGEKLTGEQSTLAIAEQRRPANWLLFFVVLFAPAICSFIFLTVNLGFLAALSAGLGSLISGLICTRMMMRRLAASGSRRLVLSFVIGILFCGLSYFLSFLGCTSATSVSHHGL